MTTAGPIHLKCSNCGNTMEYARDIDPDIPANVSRIESSMCCECDNGDFGVETWFDAENNEIIPDHSR